MINFFYALMYLCETVTCYIFFENACYRKETPGYSKYRVALTYSAVFLVSYAISFACIPFVNLVVFLLTTFFVASYCYKIKLKQRLFVTFMLTAFMLASELIVILFSAAVFNTNMPHFDEQTNAIFVTVIQAGLSKLVFFLLAFFVAKTLMSKDKPQESDKFLIALGVLPMTTIVILPMLVQFKVQAELPDTLTLWLTVSAVLLLVSNVLVFIIYDRVQRTNIQNTELILEKQKSKTRLQYYELVLSQQEDRSILIHDIKHHLNNIENSAKEGDCNGVTNYIASIRDEFGLNRSIQCSGNKLIDVILSRYSTFCKDNGIQFQAEANCASGDFLNEVDLTALIDNMFENAVESALISGEHSIVFNVSRQNNNFLVVKMKNSCDIPPEFKNGLPVTRKTGKNHGIGTKSMKKVIEKYDGELNWNYDNESKMFECEAVLMTDQKKNA